MSVAVSTTGPEAARTRTNTPLSATAVVFVAGAATLGLSLLTGNSWLLLVTGACLALMAQARFWPDRLDRVEVTVSAPRRVAAGERCSVEVMVRNDAAVPVPGFRLGVEVGGLSPCTVQVGALPPAGTARARLDATAAARGAYDSTTVLLASDDPLRLATTVHRRVLGGRVLVHPARRPAGAVAARGRPDADGDGPVRPGRGPDLVGVRDWRTGDDARRVHWRSTARHGRLVVAERGEPEASRWVLAATAVSGADRTEELVAAAAATCRVAQLSGSRVEVLAWSAPSASQQPELLRAPGDTVEGLLDWWAALTVFGVPSPGRLLADVPPGTTRLLVLDSPGLPPGWWARLRQLAADRRLDVAAVAA